MLDWVKAPDVRISTFSPDESPRTAIHFCLTFGRAFGV